VFPGKDAIGQDYPAGANTTGAIVHYVVAGVYTRTIIAQREDYILPEDTADTSKQRIQRVQPSLYPDVINPLILTKRGLFSMKIHALISVSNKVNIESFAKGLVEQDYEIISTGGTLTAIQDAGIPARAVETVTDFPEILDGRVKTLHPFIHGGL